MKTSVITTEEQFNNEKSSLREHEQSLPKNRKDLIEGMDIFNHYYEMLFVRCEKGDPSVQVNKLISIFMCTYFPIMNEPFFNDVKKIESYPTLIHQGGYLNVLNRSYEDHFGGMVNFRPEGLEGWNYFKTHKCSYDSVSQDLRFEGKNVNGVSFIETFHFLPEGFLEKMSVSELDNYYINS